MNEYTNQEEWMLMQQRQRKSRSQSLPHSALGLGIGRRGSGILNPEGSKKVANYINKIPQLIQLQQQNPPCVKLNSDDSFLDSPLPEVKRLTKIKEDKMQRTSVKPYHQEDHLSVGKDLEEVRLSNMSKLQLPDTGNSDILRYITFIRFLFSCEVRRIL